MYLKFKFRQCSTVNVKLQLVIEKKTNGIWFIGKEPR